MFNNDPHGDVWQKLQRSLKRGETEAAHKIWDENLPSLAAHYDDLRMLYYIGSHGQRDAYHYTSSTPAHLRDKSTEMLHARLAVFRYAVEQTMTGRGTIAQWMMEDVAEAVGIPLADFPEPKPELPEAIAAIVAELKASKKPPAIIRVKRE